VWVPDPQHEAMRDLVRARLDAVHSLRRARQQLSGFLLRQGCTTAGRPGRSCIAAGCRVSSSSKRSITSCWKITSPQSKREARRDRLTAQIWDNAAGLDAGPRRGGAADDARHGDGQCGDADCRTGDLSRFADPRQLMAYLGLTPSEYSSGSSVRRGGITKAGNGAARRLLIEAAWSYRFPARLSRELLLRQESQPKPIREHRLEGSSPVVRALSQARPHRQACQCRHHRDRSRADGFVWAIARQVTVTPG